MKRIIITFIGVLATNSLLNGVSEFRVDHQTYKTESTDSLPDMTSKFHAFLIESKLRQEALLKFAEHQLPDNLKDWETYRAHIKNEIIKKAGVVIDHKLPFNTKETGSIQMKGYIIKNISFQVRPGVHATANLFIPEGKGPFPAVINLHAHSGRFDDKDQAVGHSLALNGYVVLSIDPWGAGERTSIHGETEYHGSNLGASFMNIGESLMGIQISDNMRGVDLLSSLSYVDPQKIGIDGSKEAGLAGLFLSATGGELNLDNIILRDAPVSYLFDNRESIDFFSMGIHLPGFLNWGDVSLATALSGKNVTFINPLTMSGQTIRTDRLKEYQTEFDIIRRKCSQPGKVFFN